MYVGEKPRKGLSKFVAVLTALAIASASLLAVPAYAAESGAENQNPVMEFFGNIADGAAQLFGLGDDGIETYAVTGTTAVDPDTTNVWSDIAASSTSTQNIGRIWTDKSVFDHDYTFSGSLGGQTISKGDDSDFLVSLSALSSTSNLKTMVKTSVPLDIVLVLDTSGSMAGQKLTSLKNAANNFIDATVDANEGLDQSDQSRISIVTFASGSNVRQQLNYVTDQNVQQYKNTIRGLNANGATWAEAGLETAQNQLNSHPRQDAQKVVIFFTDGQPNHGNGFDNEVAAEAVNTAHAMKQSGVTIYAVGVMNGADASVTDDDDFNEYMNGVSSNYPNATAEGFNGYIFGVGAYYNTTFGTRAEGDYYKASSNASDIENIFEELSDEIQQGVGSGSPIEEVREEGELNPGTLTFTDTLGSYMTVSGDTMTVVYGDQVFTSKNKTTENNIDTYHFEGTVEGNTVYGSADLSDLTVTVAHGATLADGDVVTVQVPASLIPMRNYDVDTDANTMSVTAAYPIRLFYGVSVKADAKTAINTGSGDVYDAIVSTNKTDDGKVAFYSNLYNGGNGDTTATFTPSDGNKFYYYTQDTNLYVDQNCRQRATTWNINRYNTLYYSEPYWQITSGNNAQEVSQGIAINRGDQDWSKMTTDRQGNYYIPAGTQRLDRPASLSADKTKNETGTAATVLTPNWEDTSVAQHLGNNGKITYDLPGELEIKKSVDWGNASDETKQNQNSFEFTVNFNGDENLEGNFAYDVYETGGDPASNGTVADGGTITLKDGQRAVIKVLPADTTFTVTEAEANQNGFTTTDTVTADPSNDTTDGIANGTIAGGSQRSVSFQNNYKADEPLQYDTSTGLNVEKVLNGRDWRDGDEFTFNVQSLDGYAPTQTEVTINKDTPDHEASFGTITFDKDGEFRYVVREDNDVESPIAGIDYSNATYRLTVRVVDAGNGNLKIESAKLEMFQDDTGAEKNPAVAVEGTTATFTNYYLSDQGTININGEKAYTDTTGDNPIAPNKFQFTMEALGGYVTDGGSRDNLTVSADDTPKPTESTQGNVTTIGNVGNEFHMPTITFDGNDVGNTYVYKITEVQGSEDGMTYDSDSYEVEVTVTEAPDPEAGEGHVHILASANKTPEQLTFTNKYEPTPATLTGDDVIHGTKTLEGRQMKEGETFYFQLSAFDDNAKTVLADPETVTVTDQNSMSFKFSEMKFTKVGTYTFQVNEVADDKGTETTNADGMTFDTNICTVTVTVTDGNDSDNPDDHGKLLASVSYSNDKHSDATNRAQFTNVYEANMNYGAGGAGGIAVTKTMVDRTMDAGDYNFTLTGTGPDGEITENFSNTASAANGTVTMKQLQSLKFDEQDAEKTFIFTVDEADPTDENRLAGVEYDQSQYRVDITVHDNHDGTMYTETTVTKIKSADGTDANEIIVDKLNSSTAQGQVPTFGFENVYKPTEASLEGDAALQVTKKVTGTASPNGVNYTFTLTAQDTDEGPIANIGGLNDEGKLTVSTNGVINQDATDNTDDDIQTVSFSKLTFSKPGTYTFTVQEDQPAADDGWTFDDADNDNATDVHNVTVEVSDLNEDGEYDGALHIKSVTPEDPTLITNGYKADPVIVGGDGAQQRITVQKSVTGADSNAEFKFKIEPVIDDDHSEQWWQDRVKATEGFSPELTISRVTQEQAVTNSFAGIQFNAVGEYKFNVTEVGAADFNAGADRKGWTYDEHTATVTVKVTDEGDDGQLDAEVVYDNSNATTEADKSAQAAAFTNKYVPAEVTTGDDAKTGIQVTKKVTGHDAIEPFEFSLSLKDGQNGDAVFEGAGENKTKFDGMTLTTSDGIKAGTTETKTFKDITFTAAGDYTFVIDETTEKTDEGWTYDADSHEVTVHVKDNGVGALYIDSIDNNAPEFENIYKLTPGKFRAAYFKLQGNKVLEGRNWKAGDEFTFTLTAGEGENVDGTKMAEGEVAATMPAKTTDTIKPMEDDSKVSDNSAQFTFTSDRIPGGSTVEEDTFTYSKPGTYRYLIRETNPNVAAAGSGILGVSYDQTVYRLTVVVTDKGDGTLDAKGTYTKQEANGEWTELGGSDQITFTNTYSSDKVNITFNAFKVLQNRETAMEDNEFKFHMEFAGWKANDDQSDNWSMDGEVAEKAPAAAADKGNIIRGDVTFAGMDFTADQVGYTYRYAITEVDGGQTINGVTLDDSTHYVTAKVTSVQQANEDGTFTEHVRVETSGEAEWNEQADTAPTTGAIFINTYDPGETTVDTGNADFVLTKILKGKDWNGDKFTFTISPVSAMNGDQEIIAADSPDFPMPAETTLTVDAATGEDKDGNDLAVFSFGNITYDQEGVYTYTVEEKTPAEGEEGYNAGITYSTNKATVVVTVTDNNEGGYTTAVNITNNKFVNEYHARAEYNASGVGGLNITKKLTNHAMTDGQFSFTITADDDASAKKLGITDGLTTTVESAEAAAGDAEPVKSNPFEAVTFDETDNGVTYSYTIKENGKTGKGDYKNYVLDTNTYTVEITPTDNGDGTMTVKTVVDGTEYSNQRATVAFVNSYEATPTTVGAEGAAKIEGTKTLANDDINLYTFSFEVKSGDVVVAKGTNTGEVITFSAITYTTENLAAAANGGSDEVGTATAETTDTGTVYTFNYTVSEVAPDQSTGVTANTGSQKIKITVTDDGNGTLTPVVSYDSGTSLAFENTYGGDADFALDIAGTKEIVGGQTNPTNIPTLKGGEYEFTITGTPAADGTPAPMPAVTTVKNGAAGGVTFEDIHYTMENTFGSKPVTTNADTEATADEATTDEAATDEGIETYTAGRTQVFTYTISESGSVAGVTNEQGTKTVEVTVTDLGGGKLEAKVTSEKVNGADFKFTNVYDVTETTSSLTGDGGFNITKGFSSTNTDRALAEGEFEFQLKSGSDVVATAKNAADGTVSFGGITFTKPGTYNYVLSEVEGGKPGVDYDTTGYNVTAKAEDQGDGTLKVTWEMPQAIDGGVTFTNTYTAANTGITFEAAKVLDGRELADGEFTFELRENGKVIDTATNDADGTVAFEKVEYTEPGAHDYEIAEVKGDDSTITYDDTVFTVHVNVVDNIQTGSLDASDWSYGENGAPVFHNTYTKPAEPPAPKPEEPKPEVIPATGDAAAAAVMATAGIGAALAAAGYVTSKKRGE